MAHASHLFFVTFGCGTFAEWRFCHFLSKITLISAWQKRRFCHSATVPCYRRLRIPPVVKSAPDQFCQRLRANKSDKRHVADFRNIVSLCFLTENQLLLSLPRYTLIVSADICSNENVFSTRSLSAHPSSFRISSCSRSSRSAPSSNFESFGGTMSPVFPFSTISGMPPTDEATTGSEAPPASRSTYGNPSFREGSANISYALRYV